VTVGIHQPHFLPWMGYLNKALHSDVFIWLHSVQYRKNYFQNRTLIKNVNEQPLWLTLPVHTHLGMMIDGVTVADPQWRKRVTRTLEQCYRKAPWFGRCWPTFAQALEKATDNLDDIDFLAFGALVRSLGPKSLRIVRADELRVTSDDATQRLVELCTLVDAKRYIAGKGAHNYLQVDRFTQAGIEVVWQQFEPEKVVYPQIGNTFVPGLSAIDCLFNVGPERTRALALSAWTP
jgi:WbqC-like protein family